jgi:hypothetical protein
LGVPELSRQPSKVKQNPDPPMKPHAFLFLAAGLALAGCNDANVVQCPSAAVLSDTDTLTVFRAGAPHDLSGEAYTAGIGNVRTTCSFPKGAAASISELTFTLRAIRNPSADGADYKVPYYLAVIHGDRILSKQNLTADVNFAPGSASTSQDISASDLTVELEPGHPPTDYQFLVGFQLTDAERAYNAKRGRFTP